MLAATVAGGACRRSNPIPMIMKRWCLCPLAVFLLVAAPLHGAQPRRSPENQVFQFSHSGIRAGSATDKATLYLWIPGECRKVRGLLVMGTNVPEHMLVGHAEIRRVCEENDLGLIWSVPTFWNFAREMKGRDKEQVVLFLELLKGLARTSGYDEIENAPLLPMGESGHLLMVCGLVDQVPDRCIAGICIKNPQAPENRSVPMLWTLGTAQEWGQVRTDVRVSWRDKARSYDGWAEERARSNQALSMAVEAGTGHFHCTDEMAAFFATYIRGALKARLPVDGSTALRPVNLDAGFLANLPVPGQNEATILPHAGATAEQKKRAWFFDRATADAAIRLSTADWSADSQFLGFREGENCSVRPYAFNSVTEIVVKTGSDFSVSAFAQSRIPDGFVGAGEALRVPDSPVEIDWICGPFSPTGNGRFRVALDRTWKTGAAAYAIAHSRGGGGICRAVQPAIVRLQENTLGMAQSIDFQALPAVTDTSVPVTLAASSSSGLPVSFFVREGPAVISGNTLSFTRIPPRSRYPVRVTIGAWQWGSPEGNAVKTAPVVFQSLEIQGPSRP